MKIHLAIFGECLYVYLLSGMKKSIGVYKNLIYGNVENDYSFVAAAYTNVKLSFDSILLDIC